MFSQSDFDRKYAARADKIAENDKFYAGYIARNEREIAAYRRDAELKIPDGFVYAGLPGLTNELIEKLTADNRNTRVGIFEVTNSEYLIYKLGIKSVPTTIRYKGGTEIQRIEGTGHITRLF